MSVNPGFGGQSFIPDSLNKVRALKKMLDDRNLSHVEIEIDGGIKLENIREVADAGVDIFVSGSGIFGAPDPAAMIQRMIEELK